MITHIHTDTHTIINTQSQTHWYTHLVSRFPIGLCLIHYLERTMSLKVEVERLVYYMLKLCAFQSLNTLQCWKQWFLCSRNNYHLRILLHFEIFYNFKTIIGRFTHANDQKWFEVLFPSIHFSTQFKLFNFFASTALWIFLLHILLQFKALFITSHQKRKADAQVAFHTIHFLFNQSFTIRNILCKLVRE